MADPLFTQTGNGLAVDGSAYRAQIQTQTLEQFPVLPPLVPPPAPENELAWLMPALILLLLVSLLAAWGVNQLQSKRKAPPDPLSTARKRLDHLRQNSLSSTEAARHCARILCDAWCHRYRETLLSQPSALVLQRRAFLRQLPTELRGPLLIFLADCLESAYRPESEARPTRLILADTERLLESSARIAPPR